MKILRGATRSEALAGLFVLALLAILAAQLFPSPGCTPEPAQKSIAKNDVTQIAVAVNAYETEYGHLLTTTNGLVDGDLVSALVGSNLTLNPRKIVFIEIGQPRQGKKGGLRPDGTFVDSWGGPYRIAIATGTDTSVIAGTNQIVVPKKVAVWTDPKLHRDAASLSDREKRRRSVASWE